jgi:soluble cytochrome b562
MFQFIHDNCKELLGFLIAVWGIWKYFDARKRELAWKRTEFLFEQARLLETDNDLSDAIKILEDRHPEITIDTLYGAKADLSASKTKEYRHKFDKLLNHFDRIAYATLQRKTLSIEEAANFGWYVGLISSNDALKDYCQQEGFSDIILLLQEIDKHSKKRKNAN